MSYSKRYTESCLMHSDCLAKENLFYELLKFWIFEPVSVGQNTENAIHFVTFVLCVTCDMSKTHNFDFLFG